MYLEMPHHSITIYNILRSSSMQVTFTNDVEIFLKNSFGSISQTEWFSSEW